MANHSKASADCKVEFITKDIKPLSRQAWKHPNGPTDGERERFEHRRKCHAPHHLHPMNDYWKDKKEQYAPLREKRQLKRKCGNSSITAVNACIDFASFYKGGAPNDWMHRIASCESGKNPGAQNPSGAYGLYQFLRSTWNTTKYWSKDWTEAKWQALAAAWMYRQGRAGEWVCN